MSSSSGDDDLKTLDELFSDSEDVEFMGIMQELLTHGPALVAQEEEESSRQRRTGGSRRYLNRDREGANAMLMHHYFDEDHSYTDEQFERRFRMTRNMFIRIVDGIRNYNEQPLPAHFKFFQAGPDCTRRAPFSIHQKCTAALRQLAYGIPGDATDEYLQMAETTALEALDNFCSCVYDLFSNVYLRKPTAQDIERLYEKHHQVHGLPGMLGSIDCMHWAWKNCPTAWRGQYKRGDHGHPTIMLEAVASYDLWIWHAFFGVAGANNDVNVLQQSPLLNDLLMDAAPPSAFQVNGREYRHGYYLADGIYPEWSTFVKSHSAPPDEINKYFKRVQESARKDVERAFGVLQGKWTIVKNPARQWTINKLRRIMYACIIMHNMCVEENGYSISNSHIFYDHPTNLRGRTFEEIALARISNTQLLRQRDTHHDLRRDLAQHVWERRINN